MITACNTGQKKNMISSTQSVQRCKAQCGTIYTLCASTHSLAYVAQPMPFMPTRETDWLHHSSTNVVVITPGLSPSPDSHIVTARNTADEISSTDLIP